MKTLISILFVAGIFTSCGNIKTPQEIIDDIRYFGHDEVVEVHETTIYKENDDNEMGITEVIDPCGSETAYDEVLLRLSDNTIMAFFAQDDGRLSLLEAGSYRTTDGTNCRFDLIEVDGVLQVVSH